MPNRLVPEFSTVMYNVTCKPIQTINTCLSIFVENVWINKLYNGPFGFLRRIKEYLIWHYEIFFFIKTRHTYVLLILFQLRFINYFVKYATMVRMDRTVVTRVDPVSMSLSVTMSTVAVYRGVVQGSREISVSRVSWLWV